MRKAKAMCRFQWAFSLHSKKLMQVFGTPAMWTKPLPVKVKQINKADKRLFTLEIVKAK